MLSWNTVAVCIVIVVVFVMRGLNRFLDHDEERFRERERTLQARYDYAWARNLAAQAELIRERYHSAKLASRIHGQRRAIGRLREQLAESAPARKEK